jgi:hypothetical protein
MYHIYGRNDIRTYKDKQKSEAVLWPISHCTQHICMCVNKIVKECELIVKPEIQLKRNTRLNTVLQADDQVLTGKI